MSRGLSPKSKGFRCFRTKVQQRLPHAVKYNAAAPKYYWNLHRGNRRIVCKIKLVRSALSQPNKVQDRRDPLGCPTARWPDPRHSPILRRNKVLLSISLLSTYYNSSGGQTDPFASLHTPRFKVRYFDIDYFFPYQSRGWHRKR
jgi:hypothetical protein